MDLGDGQLKGIVHFKLFVAVEYLGQPIEQGVQTSASLHHSPARNPHPWKLLWRRLEPMVK